MRSVLLDLISTTNSSLVEYKEAFALFDKRGTGAVPREVLGDLLRALGQNPTQAEVAELVAGAPRDGTRFHAFSVAHDIHKMSGIFRSNQFPS